ncbi:hypothetical protein H8356DRAFT_1361630 [Neocallimastix lanati (nom. inval.)]|nr:hypothetical protein H8356DRAFT_1361630 [Neocallimastix sp. JGI-2020a]
MKLYLFKNWEYISQHFRIGRNVPTGQPYCIQHWRSDIYIHIITENFLNISIWTHEIMYPNANNSLINILNDSSTCATLSGEILTYNCEIEQGAISMLAHGRNNQDRI